MIIYIVCTVTDYEYGGFTINFVTTNEKKAEEYVTKHNDPWEDYTGGTNDSVFCIEYELED